MTPKISDRPLASRKRSAPEDSPLKVWTIQNSADIYSEGAAEAPSDASPRAGLRRQSRRSNVVMRTCSGQTEQTGGGGAEDPALVRPVQPGVLRHHLDGARVAHVEAIVAAQHDAIGAHGVDQEAQQVRRVADGVVGEPP